MKEPILITGCARSGTSMVAGIIDLCGAFGGDMQGPNPYNQKGMYENLKIRSTIVRPYFQSLGVDPKAQYPLAETDNIVIPFNWRERIINVMKEQGYKDGPWFYKCPKMCFNWPVWDYAFPNAKWIIVRRRTGDIIASCEKTAFMTAFNNVAVQKAIGVKSSAEGWKWWVHQHERHFREMLEAGLNCKIVWPERMVDGDYSQMYEMLEWLGLKWNSDIPKFIEPKLWKARKKKSSLILK
jgi:hypothetical protein